MVLELAPPPPGVLVIGPFLRSILGVVGPKKPGEGIKHHCFFFGGGKMFFNLS